jgi:hypothetical protein
VDFPGGHILRSTRKVFSKELQEPIPSSNFDEDFGHGVDKG